MFQYLLHTYYTYNILFLGQKTVRKPKWDRSLKKMQYISEVVEDETVVCKKHFKLGIVPSWKQLNRKHKELYSGGIFIPTTCISTEHVAIIVPYRKRSYSLRAFISHMHPFLQKQSLNYSITVIEQSGKFSGHILLRA